MSRPGYGAARLVGGFLEAIAWLLIAAALFAGFLAFAGLDRPGAGFVIGGAVGVFVAALVILVFCDLARALVDTASRTAALLDLARKWDSERTPSRPSGTTGAQGPGAGKPPVALH